MPDILVFFIENINQIIRLAVILLFFLMIFLGNLYYQRDFGEVDLVINKGAYSSAVVTLTNILKYQNKNSLNKMRIGYCYYMLGANDKAIECFCDEAVQRKYLASYIYISLLLAENQEFEKAASYLNKASSIVRRRIFSREPKLHLFEAMGWLSYLYGDKERARLHFQKVAKILNRFKVHPEFKDWRNYFFMFSRFSNSSIRRRSSVFYRMGMVHLADNEIEEAIQSFNNSKMVDGSENIYVQKSIKELEKGNHSQLSNNGSQR